MTTAAAAETIYTISPTDLVYLWDDCRRCFVDKIRNGLVLPRSFSPHFTSADRAMRKALTSVDVVDLGVGPRFKVISQGEWVESMPIIFADYRIGIKFRGQCDALVVTEDDEFFIVDYKTTTQTDEMLRKFRRQLASYIVAIERPVGRNTLPAYVDGMALLVFDPSTFVFRKEAKVGGLYGKTRWLELPRRDDQFNAFLSSVAAAVASATPPPPSDNCGVCRLRFG